MSGFPKKERQRIVDEYLQNTGRNMFVPGEFVDWLKEQPNHEAYEWFYGMDDGEAARQYRIDLARRMASGLRIVVSETETSTSKITVREYPPMCLTWVHARMVAAMRHSIHDQRSIRQSFASKVQLHLQLG
jgi:hypothetical protein